MKKGLPVFFLKSLYSLESGKKGAAAGLCYLCVEAGPWLLFPSHNLVLTVRSLRKRITNMFQWK